MDVLDSFFERLGREFGPQAQRIVTVMAEELGGCRLTFPDLKDLYRLDRDRRIRREFNGSNLSELAIRYQLHVRHVRKILSRS